MVLQWLNTREREEFYMVPSHRPKRLRFEKSDKLLLCKCTRYAAILAKCSRVLPVRDVRSALAVWKGTCKAA